ncbi:FecR domain-containing protein [Mucilaginibacter sabulilitoris]|uniref:FecR domain-containing protein n=1 Tax=Mucilaginibacter sabulilitoris TaxID=1173583 RepID=A0ABZ0TJX2_9SPHI|nr:FecR domain-containing protein [Mucilaginibacter sabulilitoris]WPU92737.1 FecR domain-containing protein [Mucilaginibacter sabulilitoris]
MEPSELKQLIDRYLNNTATEAERRIVDAWYESFDDAEKELFLSSEKEQQLKQEIYDQVKGNWYHPAGLVKTLPFLKYAAATVLFISAWWGLYKHIPKASRQKPNNYLTINTGTREVKKVDLPDGSEVWLNANSHIRISDDFQNLKQRNVYLDEGEAFFKVKRNVNRPFIVFTKSVRTQVLGTSFNINSYAELHKAVVTVATGRVQVSTHANVLGIITPGLQINYSINKDSYQINKSDASQAHSWTQGQSVLNQATFPELALTVRNIYGVQLISKNKATAKYKYNIHINTSHSLDETMKIICSVHQNTYRRKKNEIMIY